MSMFSIFNIFSNAPPLAEGYEPYCDPLTVMEEKGSVKVVGARIAAESRGDSCTLYLSVPKDRPVPRPTAAAVLPYRERSFTASDASSTSSEGSSVARAVGSVLPKFAKIGK